MEQTQLVFPAPHSWCSSYMNILHPMSLCLCSNFFLSLEYPFYILTYQNLSPSLLFNWSIIPCLAYFFNVSRDGVTNYHKYCGFRQQKIIHVLDPEVWNQIVNSNTFSPLAPGENHYLSLKASGDSWWRFFGLWQYNYNLCLPLHMTFFSASLYFHLFSLDFSLTVLI